MNLTKNKIFFGILTFLLIVNLLIIFNLNQFYIRAVLGFIFLITIPGLLIMLMMKIRGVGAWEYLVYVVGLSVSFIMFGSLAVNWILPWLNITDKPLSLLPILICFNVFLLGFWIVAYIRNKKLLLEIKSPKLNLTNRIFFVVPMLFPILSILGAFLLNNHGTNILTMIMLGGIVVYVFFLVILREKLNPNIYPWVLWMMGLSLLLMLSLRSWYLGGFDITREYYTLQLTKENFYWGMSNFKNAYNTCLSITILPTIFHSLLKINDQYIFKLFFPMIFSFFPIILYLFLSKSINKVYSFISAIFFLSWPFFIDPMVSLARQEIAFIFFGLMLLVLFTKEINPILKKVLFLIFGASMIVSHYSTSYVALALFTLTYVLTFFYKKYKKLTND